LIIHRRAVADRQIEVLVIRLQNPGDKIQHHYGLLVSQVHSIVRLDDRDIQTRIRFEEGKWELAYEGRWIPLHHMWQALSPDGAVMPTMEAPKGSIRILGIKTQAGSGDGGPDQPPYIGFVVDEVVEIMSYSLKQVMPFPRWVIRDLPTTTVWGALPAGTDNPHTILLLLDGVAVAAQHQER
jgi:chemotaxis signal transduction protein